MMKGKMMVDGEERRFQFSFAPVLVPQGDGSFLVKPGKPVLNAWLRVAEVAKRLDVTEQHVLNLIEAGELEAINVGNKSRKFWRVKVEGLDRFLEKRKER